MKIIDAALRTLSVVALISFIAGAYAPLSTEAISPANISFGPPSDAEGVNTRLTTGWHAADGISLDWDDGYTSTVYSRTWATSPDTTPTIRAFSTPETAVPYLDCENVVWLDVWDGDNPTRWWPRSG